VPVSTIGGVLLLALSLLSWPSPDGARPPAEAGPLAGQLIVARSRALGLMDAATRQEESLPLDLGPGLVRGPAWAPGRTRLAFSWFARRPGEQVGGSEIMVLDRAGGAPATLVSRAADGQILDAPVWSRDGRTLFFESQASAAQAPQLERVAADGSQRQLVLRAASGLSPAPDGSRFVCVRQEPEPALVVGDLADGSQQVVVDDPRFGALASPRFSPDGAWIAFTATLGPPDGELRPLSRDRPPGAHVARHNAPWAVWLVQPDGRGLRRLDWLDDDELSIAWGPDSRTLAAFGVTGLVLLDRDAGRPEFLARGGFGGLDWAW
jgi:Tol biopolymer transport system component